MLSIYYVITEAHSQSDALFMVIPFLHLQKVSPLFSHYKLYSSVFSPYTFFISSSLQLLSLHQSSETMRNTIFQEPEIKVSVTDAWKQFKQLKVSRIEEPLLYSAFLVCMLMFLVVFLERLYMTVLILCLKAYGKKTYTQYKLDTVREMMERNKEHPRVLIQIPIYNRSKVKL